MFGARKNFKTFNYFNYNLSQKAGFYFLLNNMLIMIWITRVIAKHYKLIYIYFHIYLVIWNTLKKTYFVTQRKNDNITNYLKKLWPTFYLFQ